MSGDSSLYISSLQYTHPDGQPALHISDVTIPLDAITILCGRNGAGKSLLAMALAGLLPRVEIVAERRSAHAPAAPLRAAHFRAESGIVFQNSEHQVVGQTVADDIAFGLKNLALDNDEIARRVAEIMAICDLTSLTHRHPLSLSGGELRRVAIAAMMVMRPRILILDEPFLNLDWQRQTQLSELIVAIRQQGIAPIIVTHNLYGVHRYAQWLLVIDQGAIIAAGPPRRVIQQAVAANIIGHDIAAALTWR